MISPMLEEVREKELILEKQIEKEDRPAFHLSPRIGWMNDPNGFSYYKNYWHMFYQYHPYKTEWGPMHWGHAISKDLLHWEYLPVVLAPDQNYDETGCFSGSAIELEDGRHLLMYTGVKKEHKGEIDSSDIQTQCLAVGDGVNYEKYSNNPVLTEKDLPKGASKIDFRDPKIWKEKDGTYRCVIGSRPEDGSGQILLYQSKDAFDWEFVCVLIENKNSYGKMWECPDFFELDGNWVLMTSPQDMLPEGLEYHNGNVTLCLIGSWNGKDGFEVQNNQCIDYGIDFYAPQTVLAPDGRRIMMGWMQNWDTCCVRKEGMKWFGQMSMPRELSIKEGKLLQNPVREITSLQVNPVEVQNVEVAGIQRIEGVQGRLLDLTLEVKPFSVNAVFHKFSVFIAENKENYTKISFCPKESTLKIDRKHSGIRRASIHQRRCLVKKQDGKIKLRIILDRYSVEIFVNDGEQVMSMCIYTDIMADGVHFEADQRVVMNILKYELKME